MIRICFALCFVIFAASCSAGGDNGPVDVAIIGEREDLYDTGVRLSPAAQHLRGASNEGLVSLDPSGQVVPAIAERWIVTDDGLSYIFRLRSSEWPDGEAITADVVRDRLRETIRRLDGTTLGLDLAKVREVRAMTGRVIEFRLTSPMPGAPASASSSPRQIRASPARWLHDPCHLPVRR